MGLRPFSPDLDAHAPGTEGYRRGVDLFNGAVSVSPRFVVTPASAVDVQACLVWLRREGFTASVRSGGHGVAGRAVAGEVVIDTRRLRDVTVSAEGVSAGSGLTWGDLDRALQARGLVVPGGTVSSTGVAGLTLGGGINWLLPELGLTCDSLIAVRGVTTEGDMVEISDVQAPEVMPFVRGFGHGLIVVTEFIYEPSVLPQRVRGGSLIYELLEAGQVLTSLVDASADCPTTINWSPALIHIGGRLVVSVDGVSTGPDPFDEWVESVVGPASRSTVRDRSYCDAQSMLDNPARWGARTGWRSLFLPSLSSRCIEEIVEAGRRAPSVGCQIFIERMCGAAKHPRRPSAFPLRDANYDILVTASWASEANDEVHASWLDSTADRLVEAESPHSPSFTYVNYADRKERGYANDSYSDLTAIRRQLDPGGILRPCYA
jgi:FAD/FMN-containing dehydrogenase